MQSVTIVGGGGAGATAAQRIIDRGLADVVLADVLEGIPAGRASTCSNRRRSSGRT